jgi:cyanophycinase
MAATATRPGPLALVGSGEFLPVMEAVDAGLLAGRPPRLLFLPTAAAQEGPSRVDYWIELATEHGRRLGVEAVPLMVLDRDGADDPGLAGQVAGAGLVYLSGGNPGYLAETLRGSLVFDAILAAWRGGTAVAGCSAGAMALTAMADDVRTGAAYPGLAVVPDLVVLPHFDRIERWQPSIVADRQSRLGAGQVLVGIDEETALVGGPAMWQVAGGQRVWLLRAGGDRQSFEAGAVLDLPAAAAIAPPC